MDPYLNLISYYILIVDDERDDHFFLRKAISDVIPQAIIESLYDGAEALEYLENCVAMPNLIFMDLNMHKVSGRDAIIAIRKNPALSNVPIVVLTTSRREDEKTDVLKCGANEFYSKPYNPKDLKAIVTDVRDKWLVEYQ